jgi:drug/metabolite transporter (DMT)-like permease
MKIKIWIAMITIYIVWGSTYLAIRFAVETMPPFLMAAFRFLVAGGILYSWRRWLAKDAGPTPIQWRSAAIVGLFLLVGGNGGVVWAETRVPSNVAALVVATTPLWMVLFDFIRPKSRIVPTFGTVMGVVTGFLGMLILIGPQQLFGSSSTLDSAGVIAVLLAAIFWSLGSLYSRKAELPSSALLGTGMEMLVGGLGLLLLGTVTGEWSQLAFTQISTRSLLSLAYLIVFGALIGFSAYTWLLRNAPTPLVATYAYVNPLIAILLGFFLAGEELSLRIVLAGLIIVSSVALINTVRIGQRYKKVKPTV